MKHWIFVAANQSTDEGLLTGRSIYETRMGDHFWGLGARTPNRKHLKKGDRVVFYVGMPEGGFAGTARLASDSFELTPGEQKELSHGAAFYTTQYGVRLAEVSAWEQVKSVRTLAPDLSFIENATQWYAYLQGGVRQIPEPDFDLIVGATVVHPDATEIVQSEAEIAFALELHLEEFLEHNWQAIDWGCALDVYHDGERNGRQYPAGTWSIDFLAVDRSTKSLVVVELKRNRSSDAAVGQVLRYMNWVRENVAVPGQLVRGIIVAPSVDEALRYAVKSLPDVEIRTYEVRFALRPHS